MEKLLVIKIGGNIIESKDSMDIVLQSFSSIKEKKILIHGGGKLATQLATQLGIETQMINGRRVTDESTLDVVMMTYAGLINKKIVSRVNGLNQLALGICGADLSLIQATKRSPLNGIDYGLVGEITSINKSKWKLLLDNNITPIVAPLSYNPNNNEIYNTNADTIAQTIATQLSDEYNVQLIYLFEKNGVLTDVDNPNSVIPFITPKNIDQLLEKNIITDGMIPKITNALAAIEANVQKVSIGGYKNLISIINQESGTTICNE